MANDCRKFFANEADARRHARLVATKIENQERQALALSPQDARIYAGAVSELKPLGLAVDSAVREIVAARKIVGDYPLLQALQFWKRHHDSAIPDKRVADVVAELVNGLRKDGRSKAHVVETQRVLKRFADTFQTNIGNITTSRRRRVFARSGCFASESQRLPAQAGRAIQFCAQGWLSARQDDCRDKVGKSERARARD